MAMTKSGFREAKGMLGLKIVCEMIDVRTTD